ncbi:MAG TPA: methionyl-tRNA formyltransferase [Dehalococcoidales bacterium]
MRIVFMGSPEFAVQVLELLILNGHQITGVYTRPDQPAGRRRELQATPVKKAALVYQVPVFQPPGFKALGAVESLKGLHPEVIVVAAFGLFLPQSVLELPRHGCLNIHPSLLPKYRGSSPVISTILAGDDFAGVSVMQLDAGMDSGPIFSRAQIPVLTQDSADSLTDKLFRIGAAMLLEVLAALPGGRLVPEPQEESQATFTREVRKEDGQINWKLPVKEIWRKVRAYQPWPETYTFWRDKSLKIVEAVPWPGVENPGAGAVISLPASSSQSGAGFGVGTGEGVLAVIRVQIEGKRAVSAAEFVRGQKEFLGSVLE